MTNGDRPPTAVLNDEPPNGGATDLPTPVVHTRHWSRFLIWLVPAAALVAFGIYAKQYSANRGQEIVIRFAEASALTEGETPIRSRGVEIGRVTKVRLSGDQTGADITLQLHRDAASFAKQGSVFWMVTPELRGGSLRGLSTVLSGPYIEARSGGGELQTTFTGLAGPPAASTTKGLSIQLLASEMKRVDRGTPVNYRGIQVGAIESSELATDATHVILRATIEPRYAALVRGNSKFWSEPSADIKGGIFSGVEVELGSLKRLFSGGISFASPDKPLERPAMGDDRFVLHTEPVEDWKKWTPQIAIDPAIPAEDSPATPKTPTR